MNQEQWIEKLTAEGFKNLSVCSNGPSTEFPEHTHHDHTVHIILQGEFALHEKDGDKLLHEGERFEIPAGTTHSAKCGSQGCTFIVGTKK